MGIRDDILSADDSDLEEILIPKWTAEPLYVCVMSGTDRDAFEASMIVQRGKSQAQNLSNIRAKLAVRCLVDKDRNRIFSDDDADALGKKSGAELQRVFEVARRKNRLSNEDVEELAKN